MNLTQLVYSKTFERLILIAIVLNAITLGLETFPDIMNEWGSLLYFLDKLFLLLFTFELILKLHVSRMNFFRDPWNCFDFIVVGIAWFPASGALSVLRSLRVLRTLRLISGIPRLRQVVVGLLTSLPGLGAVTAILLLLFYVGAVISTKLFGETFPEWFGDLGSSAYSLFQIMTLESWSMGIVRPVMEVYPNAWVFFVPFIIVTSFTTLNLLIAVIVNAMQAETESKAESRAVESHNERLEMLQEIREIRQKIEDLSSRV